MMKQYEMVRNPTVHRATTYGLVPMHHSIRTSTPGISYREFNMRVLMNDESVFRDNYVLFDIDYVTVDLVITMLILRSRGLPINHHIAKSGPEFSYELRIDTPEELYAALENNRGCSLNIHFPIFEANVPYLKRVFTLMHYVTNPAMESNSFDKVYAENGCECYLEFEGRFELAEKPPSLFELGMVLRDVQPNSRDGFSKIEGSVFTKGPDTKLFYMDSMPLTTYDTANCVIVNGIVERGKLIPITRLDI